MYYGGDEMEGQNPNIVIDSEVDLAQSQETPIGEIEPVDSAGNSQER